jgi:hypothetical protein
MRKNVAPPEKDTENSPGIEKEETVADLAHRDIDKENYRHNIEERSDPVANVMQKLRETD